jgi:predicted deacylase
MRVRVSVVLGLLALCHAVAPGQAQTALSGDIIGGVAVATRVEAESLPVGVHRFWYRASDNGIGQGWHVPIIVVRGARPGPKLLVTAGVHGDELNGIDVAHRLAAEVVPEKLTGTLTLVPGINVPGLLQSSRGLPLWGSSDGPNLNRSIGKKENDPGVTYMRGLWQDVLRPNADRVVDLHTQSRGTEYTMFVFADPRLPGVRRMAEVLNPDSIKLDPGAEGSIETAFVAAKIPAVTFELAGPERFQPEVVERGVAGIRNLMVDLGMMSGRVRIRRAFVGNKSERIAARAGGWVRRLVATGAVVGKDDVVAEQRDAFGRVVAVYRSPVAGQISMSVTTPVLELGASIMRVLHESDDSKCKDGC